MKIYNEPTGNRDSSSDSGERQRYGKKFLLHRDFARRSVPRGSETWYALRQQQQLKPEERTEILLVHNERELPLVLEIVAYLLAVHRTVRADTLEYPADRPLAPSGEFEVWVRSSETLLYLHTHESEPSPRVEAEIALFREQRGAERIGILPLRGRDGHIPSYDAYPWLAAYPEVGVDELAWFVRRFRYGDRYRKGQSR